MKFKELLEKTKARGSKSYKIIGDIMVVKLEKWTDEFVSEVRKMYPYIKSIINLRGISGELRVPDTEVIWTCSEEPTKTTHKEWGILYRIDVSRVMFSKGNFLERGRIMRSVREGERVLDMFAGIGYFTLPAAKAGAHVTAVEKNPHAYALLVENIKLNNLNEKVVAINVDNRHVSGIGKFSRIIMGYFPGTEKFLETAKKFSTPETVIHYHNTYVLHEIPEKPIREIRQVFRDAEIILWRRVKKFGPSRLHVVVDFVAGS